MKPYYADKSVQIFHGDSLDVLRELPASSIDSVVTDPPYGIAFMGKAWDQPGKFGSAKKNGTPGKAHREGNDGAGAMDAGRYDLSPSAMLNFQRWCEAWATECLRVLKPGGHIIAFGGARTWHRLAAGIEDAGFEIRDSIAWMYAQGFPKSLDVSKAITSTQLGHGGNSGAIRRATMGDEYELSGVRGNRDGVTRRSDTGMADRTLAPTSDAEQWQGWGTALKPAFEPIVLARRTFDGTTAANVLEYGTGALNIDGCRIGDDERIREESDGTYASANSSMSGHNTGRPPARVVTGRWPANVILDEDQAAVLDEQSGVLSSGTVRTGTERASRPGGTIYGADVRNFSAADTYGDTGGASRFFYVAKAGSAERVRVDGVAHPTVKPLDLMRWCARLITPPGGKVLDLFAGSGTTGEACLLEGFACVLIEREAEYLPLIVQRILRRRDPVAAVRAAGDDGGLFDLLDGGIA